jgi:hypothetical protein
MKKIPKGSWSILTALIVTGLVLTFNACSQQSPFDATQRNDNDKVALGKVNLQTRTAYDYTGQDAVLYGDSYPQSNSVVINYFGPRKGYQRGSMNLPNGSKFEISLGALTPPEGTADGDPVTITMTCEKDTVNNGLLFTYGPHGSRFSPPATLTLSWRDLDIEVPKLYYVDEEGNYIEQVPEDMDVVGKWLIISVHHFSRYAVAWAR